MSAGSWIHTLKDIRAKEPHMDRENDLIDTDALLHIGRPYWFDRHPSQAEGEDF